MNTDILFADNLDDMISGSFDRYCTHALCREGEASFLMTGEWFRMRKGDCVIFTHNELISKIEISDDFQVTVLYISNSFSFKNIPRNDYDVIGKLTLLRNPIMSLTEREQRIFMEDIELIRRRLTDHTHRFHDELIGCLAKTFVLDLYDFHARIYESPSVSEQNAVLMERFINLLKAGDYRNHREVSYYASRLCITPKYLTEVCKKASGFTANYWIDRFTISRITHLLPDKNLTLKEISDNMNFSSLSFFSRYVQRLLKVSPSEYRNGNLIA